METDEQDNIQSILLRLVEEEIISDIEKTETGSKIDVKEQMADLYGWLKRADWKTSIRILQLIKYVNTPDISRLRIKQTNPLMIDHILENVFGFLKPWDLKDCTAVCKKWNSIADPVFKPNCIVKFPLVTPDGELGIRDFLSTFQNAQTNVSKFHFTYKSTVDIALLTELFFVYGNFITDVKIDTIELTDDDETVEEWDITYIMANSSITNLYIKGTLREGYPSNMLITLDLLPNVKSLYLEDCFIVIGSETKINPTEITLIHNCGTQDGNHMLDVCINDVLNFSEAKSVKINCMLHGSNVILDVGIGSADIDSLDLDSVRVQNWNSSQWVVDKLTLARVDFFERPTMKFRELSTIGGRVIDLSTMPLTLEKLSVLDSHTTVGSTDTDEEDLSQLQKLHLIGNISSVPDFANCSNLEELQLSGKFTDFKVLALALLPRSLKRIQLHDITVQGAADPAMDLNILILDRYCFSEAARVSRSLKPDNLILKWDPEGTYEVSDSIIGFWRDVRGFYVTFLAVGPIDDLLTKKFESYDLFDDEDNEENNLANVSPYFTLQRRYRAIIPEQDFAALFNFDNIHTYIKHHLYYAT